MAEKKTKIGTRKDFVDWATEIYCNDCAHARDCNMVYLCPPLESAWISVEEYFAEKEAKKE